MADTTPRPLATRAIARSFPPSEAEDPSPITIDYSLFVTGGTDAPAVRTRVVRERSPDGESGDRYRVVVEVEGVHPGGRAFPPPLDGTALRPGRGTTSPDIDSSLLEGFIPRHLGRTPSPRDRTRSFPTGMPKLDRKVMRPTTVFVPDDRRAFQDTSYPWGTVGLVETARGSGSGVVIGPRHLLTVSHVIDWDGAPGFAANWVRFTPSSFDGTAPFGQTHGAHIYWYVRENGDGTITSDEVKHDYVVVVLDSRVGERTGWMGARGYSNSWDGLTVWQHMGYPGDLNSGARPTFQSGFALDGDGDEAHERIKHRADVFPGQSGGPIFGWWSGEVGPRAVATQSAQTSSDNWGSGGGDLDQLVIRARTDFS